MAVRTGVARDAVGHTPQRQQRNPHLKQNDKIRMLFAVAILLSNASSIIVPRERIHLSCVLALEQVGGVEIILTQHNTIRGELQHN